MRYLLYLLLNTYLLFAPDFVHILNTYTAQEISHLGDTTSMRYFVKQKVELQKVSLSPDEITAIQMYVGDAGSVPSGYAGEPMSARERFILDNITDGCEKIEPMPDYPIYSGQAIGQDGQPFPEVGDYMVAEKRPWSFTPDENVAAHFLKSKLSKPGSKSMAAIYKVERPLKAKPISAFVPEPVYEKEVEMLYPPGTATRVESIDIRTLSDNRQFAEITLKEVNGVDYNKQVLNYKGGPPFTQEALEQTPEKFRIKSIPESSASCSSAP